MPSKQTTPFRPASLAAQVIRPADEPFVDATRALLKAGYLLSSRPDRPYSSYDLTLAQVDVLAALAQSGKDSLSCSEIAEQTLITKGGITGILDRLDARGLIKRTSARDDRRSVKVRLSAKGIELLHMLMPELARSSRSLFEKAFGPEQMKEFGNLLQILVRSLEKQ
jgi:MarR family transcriptional regulator, 2-MHQ and catechol-resistance regulon repressor